jgi:16S rRNA (guanine(966)-N(2))-methyltransferase RsmD
MARGFVRIIGGVARSRRLHIPSRVRIRPTSDRIKESLFDIIKLYVEDSIVLDLFAGLGNLGIEALSRGAKRATFVEKEIRCVRVIEENLLKLGFQERGEIVKMDCLSAISWFGRQSRRFSLIFLDPPYCKGLICKSIHAINERRIIEKGGCIVAQHSFRESVPDRCGSLVLWDQRAYGETRLSLYGVEERPFI